MAKAIEVATELMKLAESIAKGGDVTIESPLIYFSCAYGSAPKENFLNIAALLPRPLKKVYSDTAFTLEYISEGISVKASTSRSSVCEMVTPASELNSQFITTHSTLHAL